MSITVEQSQEDLTIRSIFNYLNESGREVYVAIDEFQQIGEYPESGTEAMLRSYIQFAQHVHFIFSGSKHHLMAEIFGSPKHPFYQSTEMMGLKPLKSDVYYDFCRNFFVKKGGALSEEVFMYIYDEFEGHTWYVQTIMNRLYENETEVDSIQQANRAILCPLPDAKRNTKAWCSSSRRISLPCSRLLPKKEWFRSPRQESSLRCTGLAEQAAQRRR